MIPPLLYAIPRLLLFVVPIFITIKEKRKNHDSVEEQQPSPEPEGKDT